MSEKKEMQTPAYWRKRAEEARASAAEMRNPAAKALLEAIASLYDRIAEQTERRSNGRKGDGDGTE
jgi:hypothetical protein